MRTLLSLSLLLSLASASAAAPNTSEAKQIAARVLRDVVEEAIGLQTRNGTIYIAVLHELHESGTPTLTLLRKIGNGYSSIWENDTLCCSFNGNIQLKDFNHDNVPEFYYEGASYGSGISSNDFILIDTNSKEQYQAEISVGNNSGRGSIEYSPNILKPAAANILTFVQGRVEKSEFYANTQKGPSMVERWDQKYGRFVEGGWDKVKIQPAPSSLKSEDCKFLDEYLKKPDKNTNVKIGNLTYIAGFKEAVYAVDLKKNQCYVVYMPETYYDWIYPLSKDARGRLIMHDRTTYNKIVYYDPKTFMLSR